MNSESFAMGCKHLLNKNYLGYLLILVLVGATFFSAIDAIGQV